MKPNEQPLLLRIASAWWTLAVAMLLATAARADEPRRPNVVVIVGDDMGYADVGFHGCQDIPTPQMDRLAASGVRCTNGYVTGPYCSPTRAALLTGRYQQRFGHEFNPGRAQTKPGVTFGLPLDQKTLAERLGAAGYATGMVGKWHLGEERAYRPPQRGFAEYYGFLGGGHSYFPARGEPIYRGNDETPPPDYLTDAFAQEAVAFVERHRQEPFFLYLTFNAVHTPMHATADRLAKFAHIADQRRRTYAAMMVAMDEAIGRTLDALKQHQLEDNTLVFFISDNGGPSMNGTTVNGSDNRPLRGSKRTTLEGGIRVPFVVRWPAKLTAGRGYDAPVAQIDILPTVLAAAKLETSDDDRLDGVNLLPYLQGEETKRPHETLYWRLGGQMAIRHGDYKLVQYDVAADGAGTGLRPRRPGTARGVSPPRLYDLAADIGEARDLSAEKPDVAADLMKRWQAWSEQMAEPLWGP